MSLTNFGVSINKKNKILLFILLLVLFLLTVNFSKFLITIKNPSISLNKYPVRANNNDLYSFYCKFQKINLYNYNNAVKLDNSWLSIADVSCSYLNIDGKKETIYLPLRIYNQDTNELLFFGAQKQIKTNEEVIEIISKTNLGWYENMIAELLKDSPEVNKEIKIFANFPDKIYSSNESLGAGFDSLYQENPPYTQTDLNNFYNTGYVKYLPKIDKKTYFWPIIGWSF